MTQKPTTSLFRSRRRLYMIVGLLSFIIVFGGLGIPVNAGLVGDIFDYFIGGATAPFFAVATWMVTIPFIIMQAILTAINAVLAWLLFYLATYDKFIYNPIVEIGWVAVRDLANLGFITILIWIAFAAMIPGLGGGLDYKKALPKLLLMAVLINFSRMITGILIDISQVVVLTFLKPFRDNGPGIILGFMDTFKTGTFAPIIFVREKGVEALKVSGQADVFTSTIVSMMTDTIFLAMTAVVFGIMMVMFLGRLIALWILTIFSPFAFLLSVVPQTQKYAKEWWGQLGKNLTAAPILAFFLWLTFAINSDGGVPLSGILEKKTPEELAIALNKPNITKEEKNKINFDQEVAMKTASLSVGEGARGTMASIAKLIITIALLMEGIKRAVESGAAGASIAKKIPAGIKKAGKFVGKGVTKGADRYMAQGGLANMASAMTGGRLGKKGGLLDQYGRLASPTLAKEAWKKGQKDKDEDAFEAADAKRAMAVGQDLVSERVEVKDKGGKIIQEKRRAQDTVERNIKREEREKEEKKVADAKKDLVADEPSRADVANRLVEAGGIGPKGTEEKSAVKAKAAFAVNEESGGNAQTLAEAGIGMNNAGVATNATIAGDMVKILGEDAASVATQQAKQNLSAGKDSTAFDMVNAETGKTTDKVQEGISSISEAQARAMGERRKEKDANFDVDAYVKATQDAKMMKPEDSLDKNNAAHADLMELNATAARASWLEDSEQGQKIKNMSAGTRGFEMKKGGPDGKVVTGGMTLQGEEEFKALTAADTTSLEKMRQVPKKRAARVGVSADTYATEAEATAAGFQKGDKKVDVSQVVKAMQLNSDTALADLESTKISPDQQIRLVAAAQKVDPKLKFEDFGKAPEPVVEPAVARAKERVAAADVSSGKKLTDPQKQKMEVEFTDNERAKDRVNAEEKKRGKPIPEAEKEALQREYEVDEFVERTESGKSEAERNEMKKKKVRELSEDEAYREEEKREKQKIKPEAPVEPAVARARDRVAAADRVRKSKGEAPLTESEKKTMEGTFVNEEKKKDRVKDEELATGLEQPTVPTIDLSQVQSALQDVVNRLGAEFTGVADKAGRVFEGLRTSSGSQTSAIQQSLDRISRGQREMTKAITTLSRAILGKIPPPKPKPGGASGPATAGPKGRLP